MVDRPRVFIVDHNADILDLLSFAIESTVGCEVRVALGYEPGNLATIQAFRPNLLVLDFFPGRIGDWQLLDRLQANETTKDIPVLALSTSPNLVEQALARPNVRGGLVKPFDIAELERVVRNLLSRSSA